MKIYANPDKLDEGEVECRKHCNDHDLDGIKVLAMNLIDSQQVYVCIQEEDGNVVSTIQDLRKLGIMVHSLLKQSKELT
jgi:hypothetical protein